MNSKFEKGEIMNKQKDPDVIALLNLLADDKGCGQEAKPAEGDKADCPSHKTDHPPKASRSARNEAQEYHWQAQNAWLVSH
jgi:hypothetical protein